MALTNAVRTDQPQSGLMSMLVAAALAALEGIFDVAESYLLPAIMIEQLPLKEAAEKLRQLKGNIPTALFGAFGIDITGGALGSAFFVVYLGILLLAGLIAWAAGHIATFPPSLLTNIPFNHQPLPIFVFPLVGAITLISFINGLIKIFSTSVKATYFAIFYTAINKPNEISADIKDKIIAYLNLPTQP